jgi:hypothetical protein
VTYYLEQPAGWAGRTCEIQAAFSSSRDNGQTWTAPRTLSDPMRLAWIAPTTTQGAMVGDYISFLAGQQRALNAFAIGFGPTNNGLLNEPMFGATEKVRPAPTRYATTLCRSPAPTPSSQLRPLSDREHAERATAHHLARSAPQLLQYDSNAQTPPCKGDRSR